MASTGWTLPDVDELSLGDVNDLMEYWSKTPPAHISLAKIANVLEQVFCEPGETAKGKKESGDLADLLAMFPTGQI